MAKDNREIQVLSDREHVLLRPNTYIGSVVPLEKEEWILNNDIIKRQVLISRNLSNYKGFSLFRYDYIFKEDINEYQLNERNNLFSIM
jgi:hypothetical protein